MFAEEIRRAAETAPRAGLPAVSALLWKAFAAGGVSEAEAEALSVLIEARKVVPVAPPRPLSARRGSRPRTDASMARRRRWAASGRLPPQLACLFTLAEQAVLSALAAESVQRGNCRLAVGHLAALAGVSESTVRNALREAARHGLVTIEARRVSAWRNQTNVVRIVAPAWTSWLRLGRTGEGIGAGAGGGQGGGCKSVNPTSTHSLNPGKNRRTSVARVCRKEEGNPPRSGSLRFVEPSRTGRAMR